MSASSAARPRAGQVVPVLVAVLLVLPAVVVTMSGSAVGAVLGVGIYGAAFVGAALLLAWGTELAQLDLPRGLAVTILALIAILPEYAVDLLFAWEAGNDPSKAPLALANMTGANRLLIGIGWSLVVLVGAVGARRAAGKRRDDAPAPRQGYAMALTRLAAVDVVILALASIYTLQMLVRSSLTLVDTAVLLTLFVVYLIRQWRAPTGEPEFMGPPALISHWRPAPRRLVTLAFMVAAAAVILVSAEPFSASLITAGDRLGVDQFLMVQWVAPLATETAELIPAALFAWRQSADEGLGTLLSSKINQWTLLVGAIPVAYALSSGSLHGLPVDGLQQQELFLTAAQSIFAVMLLVDLSLGVGEAALILLLFLADFSASVLLPADDRVYPRIGFAVLYLVLALGAAWQRRDRFAGLLRDGVRTDPRVLAAGAGDRTDGGARPG